MSTPRRRIIRPPALTPSTHDRQRQQLRARLERARASLARWQSRFKHAFNAITKHQKAITRIDRRIAQLEES